jgi:hypothetical protein
MWTCALEKPDAFAVRSALRINGPTRKELKSRPRAAFSLCGLHPQYQPIVGFCASAKCDDDHFPYRLPQQCFGNDSDVPRIFILNFTSTSGPHAQGEYLVFDMEDLKTHEKAVVLVSTKKA